MKHRLLGWCTTLIVLLYTPGITLARRVEEEKEIVDARLEGYGDKINVSLPASGTALMWLLLLFLGAVCVGVMFKDAKRTHLD